MKYYYITVVLVFYMQFSFSQIGFNENIIVDQFNYADGAFSVFAIDVDNDNNIDVLSADSNKIVWYKNIDGNGNYDIPKLITTEIEGINSVYATDIDGDGDSDVLSTSSVLDEVAWYENLNGLGDFGPKQIITLSANFPYKVFSADIDNDGDMDVLSASSVDSKIAWYENTDGLGTFGGQQIITTNAQAAFSLHIADIDGDNDMDVISASVNDDKIAWYENIDGQGTFGNQEIISSSFDGARSVFSADFDNDGDMDVVSGSFFGELIWYENTNGLGAFTQKQILTIANRAVVHVEDIDGDNDYDIVAISPFSVVWFENTDSLGTFGVQNVISTEVDNAQSVYVEDIDNDGDRDVLTASGNDGKIAWYKNTDGLGSFSEQLEITTHSKQAQSAISVDIDGDGDEDIVSASALDNRIAWYRNTDGQGGYGVQQVISINAEKAFSVNAADIDGDGDIDVFSASADDDKIAWYENMDGNGSFGEQQIISEDANFAVVVISADINGDGNIDALSASAYDDKIAWYENSDGLGDFGGQQIISDIANNVKSIQVADFDGDNDIDVVAVHSFNLVTWYENTDGLGTFSAAQLVDPNLDAGSYVFVADFDGDGDNDLVASSAIFTASPRLVWYENTDALGNFGPSQLIRDDLDGIWSLFAKDMDGDNDIDLLSASNNLVAWYENTDGQGSFGSEQIITTNLVSPRSVFTADLDGDGDNDVISASESDNTVSWFENLGSVTNEILGNIIYDNDSDGCDLMDINVANILVTTESTLDTLSTFSLNNGIYQLFPNTGEYATSVTSNLPNYFDITPNSQVSNFNGTGDTENIDFCITANQVVNDLNVVIYPPINGPRPGFFTKYQIVYSNFGTTTLSGSVVFTYNDAKLQFVHASETIASQTVDMLTFNFDNLNPFETRTIDIDFRLYAPPVTNSGETIISSAIVNPILGDETEEDNSFELEQIIVGSYDPNDIMVLEGDEIFIEDADKYLHYLIRFQNTGTASAINVRVEHALDDKLDWSTMQLESLSHSGRVEIEDQTDVSFVFNNINLPDSTNDEPNSHGYIAYKIKPKSDVEIGDVFSAVADIYFDFNPPIITNTATTEIVEPLSVVEFDLSRVNLYPNPAKDKLEITSNQIIDKLVVIDINGRLLRTIDVLETQYNLDVSKLSKGVYFLEVQTETSKTIEKFIKN